MSTTEIDTTALIKILTEGPRDAPTSPSTIQPIAELAYTAELRDGVEKAMASYINRLKETEMDDAWFVIFIKRIKALQALWSVL